MKSSEIHNTEWNATGMSSRELFKHELIDEIKRQLAQDNAPLTPIVQDSARLALICQKHYYNMLFRSHIDGGLPKGDRLAPTFQAEALREQVLKDFQSDRMWSITIHNNPLQQVEEHLQQIQQNMKSMNPPMNENPPRESKFWDAKIGITYVLMNMVLSQFSFEAS
jgi:hypothetical protein